MSTNNWGDQMGSIHYAEATSQPRRWRRWFTIGAALTAIALGAISPSSRAAEPAVEQLLQSVRRPRIADIVAAFPQWPATNPFLSPSQVAQRRFVTDAVRTGGPQLIARLEKAYPGAIWAPLGRDINFAGDFLDTFYRSIGQTGRVAPLDASTATFMNTTDEQITQFMTSNGLDLKNIGQTRPFIIIDMTSYGVSSQTTLLIKAGYNSYVKSGGRASDLLRHFNLMCVGQSGRGSAYGPSVESGADLDGFFARQAPLTDAKGRPTEILQTVPYESQDPAGAQRGYKVFTYVFHQWHQGFGALKTRDDGTIGGLPGQPMGREQRLTVLSDLYEMMNVVNDPSFIEKVKAEAKRVGYTFTGDFVPGAVPVQVAAAPVAPAAPAIPPKAFIFSDEIRSLEESVRALGPVGEQNGYLTDNAQVMQKWFDATIPRVKYMQRQHPIVQYIAQLGKARESGRIGTRDFRRLLGNALAAADSMDAQFMSDMRKLIESDRKLLKTLVERNDFFLNTGRPNAVATSTTYHAIDRKILQGCNTLLAG